MCLPLAVRRPDLVLASGTHAGFDWIVVHNGYGHRCGYTRVPPGHPWHGADINDVNVDVHGGVTFSKADLDCGKGDDNGWWIGFDCNHAWDAPDPSLPLDDDYRKVLDSLSAPPPRSFFGEVRTQEYVEAECRSLCEQAAAVGISPAPPS